MYSFTFDDDDTVVAQFNCSFFLLCAIAFQTYIFIFLLIPFLFSLSLFLFNDLDFKRPLSSFKKRASMKKDRTFGEKIFVNGYRFVIASQSATTVYLKCANFRNNCKARASRRKNSVEVYMTKSEHKNCIPTPSSEYDEDILNLGDYPRSDYSTELETTDSYLPYEK